MARFEVSATRQLAAVRGVWDRSPRTVSHRFLAAAACLLDRTYWSGLVVYDELACLACALDETAPSFVTVNLAGDLSSARQRSVIRRAGLRPLPRLPLKVPPWSTTTTRRLAGTLRRGGSLSRS